jgi:hypothetical protein
MDYAKGVKASKRIITLLKNGDLPDSLEDCTNKDERQRANINYSKWLTQAGSADPLLKSLIMEFKSEWVSSKSNGDHEDDGDIEGEHENDYPELPSDASLDRILSKLFSEYVGKSDEKNDSILDLIECKLMTNQMLKLHGLKNILAALDMTVNTPMK